MKKKFFYSFAILFTFSCCLLLMACGSKWHWHKAVAPTCEEGGNIGYYTCDDQEGYFDRDKQPVNELEVFLGALGHDWEDPTYVWAQDYSTCTATMVCANDSSHVITETVVPDAVLVHEQTCKDNEVKTFTATFTTEGFVTAHRYNVITKYAIGGEHNYVYDDVKGKYVCSKCHDEQDVTDSSLLHISYGVLRRVEDSFEGALFVPNGVTGIYEHALEGNTRITAVYFPNTLTSIGEYAFAACTNLRNFTLPEGLRAIGRRAFSNNTNNVMTQLIIPNSVTEIEKYAFYGLKYTTDYKDEPYLENSSVPNIAVRLSSAMTTLESGVFGKAKVSSIDFNGANIVKIKNESLHYNHLTTINLPQSLVMIYDHALNNNHLSAIDISGTQVNDIGLGAFDNQTDITNGDPINLYNDWQGGHYFGKGNNNYYFLVRWDYNVNNSGASAGAVIHSDTKCLASELLNTSLNMSSSSSSDNRYRSLLGNDYEIKQTIGNLTFVSYPYRLWDDDGKFCLKRIDVVQGTNELDITSIELPNYISDYEYGVLTNFTNLEELNITLAFGRLGNFFCDHSVNLDSENHDDLVPHSLTTVNVVGSRTCNIIESGAFQGLAHVQNVIIGPNITSIKRFAFYECVGLTSVVMQNESTFEISSSAFEECNNLQEFTYNTNYSVTFGADCFWNTGLVSFVVSSGSTMGTTMLGSCIHLKYVYIYSNTTITLNEIDNSPFTKCRAVATDKDSAISLKIYTNGSEDGANWCENWNDTSHYNDEVKQGYDRVIKPAEVVYNTTLDDFYLVVENENA